MRTSTSSRDCGGSSRSRIPASQSRVGWDSVAARARCCSSWPTAWAASKGGEEASSRTLDTIVRYVAGSSLFFSNLDQEGQRALLHDLTLSVQWSHAAVRNEAAASTSLQGMATTLTMVLVLWPRAYVVQIGDSRCYHLRPPTITQVTKDQTMAQEMIDQGLLPAAAAERSPLSHVLSQAVGNKESEIWPEISSLDLEPGDTLLLCTDGLTKHVAERADRRVDDEGGLGQRGVRLADRCGTDGTAAATTSRWL